MCKNLVAMKTKEKKTIEEGINELKIGEPSSFWWFGYTFLSHLWFFAPKYHPTYKIIDDINEEKGPAFLIWNHQSRRDYLFIKNIVEPRKFNMIAGYTEFHKAHLRPLFNKVAVIPKKNFTQDLTFIKFISKRIRQGGTITFSPEGMSSIYGCNQPIVPGTGKFLKHFKIPVYFMKLEGAYLSSHKTCTDDHPGKVFATLSRLYTKEDLERLSPEEIEDQINTLFTHDDYAWNKEKRIKYKTKGKAAVNMSSIAYKCPKCGKEMMIDNNNILRCENCGNGCTINDYYDFIPFDENCVIPESLTKWVEYERGEIIKEIRQDHEYSFSFKTRIGDLPKYELIKDKKLGSVECGEGTFTVDHQGLHFVGTRHGEEFKFDLPYEIYYTLVIEEATDCFSLYVNGEYIEVKPYDVRSVGKALLLTEEMHRLHVNTWKHLPNIDYLYKGTELEKK